MNDRNQQILSLIDRALSSARQARALSLDDTSHPARDGFARYSDKIVRDFRTTSFAVSLARSQTGGLQVRGTARRHDACGLGRKRSKRTRAVPQLARHC